MDKIIRMRQRRNWWTPPLIRAVQRRLDRRREQIAALLAIDPAWREWRTEPAPYPDSPVNDVAAYVEWRHAQPRGGTEVSLLDVALEELEEALLRTWGIYRYVNRDASDPRIRRELEALLRDSRSIRVYLWDLSAGTRSLIEDCLPRGKRILEDENQTETELFAAVEKALVVLPPARRGRPSGSVDHATRYLALLLAEIYETWSGRRPTRRRDSIADREYGPFKSFVEEVVAVIPPRLRKYIDAPSGSVMTKSADYMVRLAIGLRRDHSKKPAE